MKDDTKGIRSWRISPKWGFGVKSPNTRKDGDPYDCYNIATQNGATSFQMDGIRYPSVPVWCLEGLCTYIAVNKSAFTKPQVDWAFAQLPGMNRELVEVKP